MRLVALAALLCCASASSTCLEATFESGTDGVTTWGSGSTQWVRGSGYTPTGYTPGYYPGYTGPDDAHSGSPNDLAAGTNSRVLDTDRC